MIHTFRRFAFLIVLGLAPSSMAANGPATVSTGQYSVTVPADATRLTVSVDTTVSVSIYVRFGQPVAIDHANPEFDHKLNAAPGESVLDVTPESAPPLRAGTYHVAYATEQGQVKVSLSVSSGGAGQAPAVSPAAVVNGASFGPEIASGGFVTIYGQNFTDRQLLWDTAIPENGALPTSLGGVRVRINGQDCFVNYASPTQINVLAPPDTALGTVPVEVITSQGTARSVATLAQFSPGLFAFRLNGRSHAVAQFANTAMYVAPAAAMQGVSSRPAGPGDLLQLYATGLGGTTPSAPAGRVLKEVYPISDLSRVKAVIGGLPAEVLFAGLTFAGVFQVNVRVPDGVADGELPVVLVIEGRSTQPDAVLTFAR